MKRSMKAGIAFFCLMVQGIADDSSPGSQNNTINIIEDGNGNSNNNNQDPATFVDPLPMLWIGPAFYYGTWFDSPEEYNHWTQNNYRPNEANQQARIDNREANRQGRQDNRQDNRQGRQGNRQERQGGGERRGGGGRGR